MWGLFCWSLQSHFPLCSLSSEVAPMDAVNRLPCLPAYSGFQPVGSIRIILEGWRKVRSGYVLPYPLPCQVSSFVCVLQPLLSRIFLFVDFGNCSTPPFGAGILTALFLTNSIFWVSSSSYPHLCKWSLCNNNSQLIQRDASPTSGWDLDWYLHLS